MFSLLYCAFITKLVPNARIQQHFGPTLNLHGNVEVWAVGMMGQYVWKVQLATAAAIHRHFGPTETSRSSVVKCHAGKKVQHVFCQLRAIAVVIHLYQLLIGNVAAMIGVSCH